MATSEQIKSLIRSHYSSEPERFTTIALQLAAHEAKQGHTALAHDIRSIVDNSKPAKTKFIQFNSELADQVISSTPRERLSDLFLPEDIHLRIERILREYHQQEKLKKHGLSNRRKILLAGPPGTGKTMTAAVLAGELHLHLHTILMDKMITKFMGETSAKLRLIFDIIQKTRGIYLFDEFDAIGAQRGRDNEVGEMRRVLNSFLQFIEQDNSDSLIVAATNNPQILDQALYRRFDDVLYYHLPTDEEIKQLIINRLGNFRKKTVSLDSSVREAKKLSHAEITQACNDAIKETILADKDTVTIKLLNKMLHERRLAYKII